MFVAGPLLTTEKIPDPPIFVPLSEHGAAAALQRIVAGDFH
jgi:hypothetical protein